MTSRLDNIDENVKRQYIKIKKRKKEIRELKKQIEILLARTPKHFPRPKTPRRIP